MRLSIRMPNTGAAAHEAMNDPKVRSAAFSWQRVCGLDVATVALLLIAAYLLAGTGEYHRYSYYEELRNVVCVAWILAAIRFFVFRWFPVTILGVILAWLFNPIVLITMEKEQWQPYDQGTMFLSIAAAVTLASLSIIKNRRESAAALPPQEAHR